MRGTTGFAGALVLSALMLAVLCGTNVKAEKEKSPTGKAAVAGKPTTPELKAFEVANGNPAEISQTLTAVYTALRGPIQGANGLRLAVGPRSKTLFVRGTEKEIEVVGDLLRILDAEPGATAPESKFVKLIRLQNTKVAEVVPVLQALGLQSQVIALPTLNAFVINKETDSKEAQTVIEKLDGEKKPADKKPVEKLPKKS
jgi:type II secretory pathway component GspD/PulD (secretin)